MDGVTAQRVDIRVSNAGRARARALYLPFFLLLHQNMYIFDHGAESTAPLTRCHLPHSLPPLPPTPCPSVQLEDLLSPALVGDDELLAVGMDTDEATAFHRARFDTKKQQVSIHTLLPRRGGAGEGGS